MGVIYYLQPRVDCSARRMTLIARRTSPHESQIADSGVRARLLYVANELMSKNAYGQWSCIVRLALRKAAPIEKEKRVTRHLAEPHPSLFSYK